MKADLERTRMQLEDEHSRQMRERRASAIGHGDNEVVITAT
jgi:hypothetical protein